MRYLFLFLLFASIWSCVPPAETDELDIKIDLALPEHQEVYDAKDRGEVDAIKAYYNSDDVTIRYLAAYASASLKDTALCTPLLRLVNNDPSSEVRAVAAYSLGQIGSDHLLDHLVRSFVGQDTSNYNSNVRGAILEAVGKCGGDQELNQLATISTYEAGDDQLLLGQARALYRFGLRQMITQDGTNAMVKILMNTEVNQEARLMAAHYLFRNPTANITQFENDLMDLLGSEQDPKIRMALAGALTIRGRDAQFSQLFSLLQSDPDYRVRTNILRSLGAYDYSVYRDSLLQLLDDPDDQIFDLASNHFLNNLSQSEYAEFVEKARAEEAPLRKARLYAIALNSLPSGFINTRRAIIADMVRGLDEANNYLEQLAWLTALSYDPLNIQIINDRGLQSTHTVIRTGSVQLIPNLLTNKRTVSVFRRPSALNSFRSSVTSMLTDLLQQGDPGTVAAVSGLIRNAQCGFKSEIGLNLQVRQAMRKLTLPTDLEARQECLLTLGYLEDTTYTIDPPSFNHPIKWENIAEINDTTKAYIITTKGQIELELFKNQSPGSVANFVDLAQSNFYDGKTIHRVVPNFVIQGGCPRGDGYGSLDYTIRSDLGPLYYDDEGFLGMASAGNNTEGTQWFITHSPTPHLDGRYTIFGRVTSGMDVVHSIRVGDVIQDVRVLKF